MSTPLGLLETAYKFLERHNVTCEHARDLDDLAIDLAAELHAVLAEAVAERGCAPHHGTLVDCSEHEEINRLALADLTQQLADARSERDEMQQVKNEEIAEVSAYWQAQLAEARAALKFCAEWAHWCGGSGDFSERGLARAGWLKWLEEEEKHAPALAAATGKA